MLQNNRDKTNGHHQDAPTSRRGEHPSTYVVQDRSNLAEMTRLQIQDQIVTAGMGGVLPEQDDPQRFQQVIDVGCGTGGWLIALAKEYPTIKRLVGIDISAKMLDYAREQAKQEGVGDRVEFAVMDAIRLLEFPKNTFDLVNQRFGQSYLRKWDWPNVLRELERVCRPKGVVRLTEGGFIQSSSPALTHLQALFLQALHQAGHFFTPTDDGVTSSLAPMLQQYGFGQVQTHASLLTYRSGTAEVQRLSEDMKYVFQNIVPFLRKWTRVPDDYEESYQQMLTEMQHPDFTATWNLLTAWGMPPPKRGKMEERD